MIPDWHIKCESNKKCTIYKDKEEKHPVITLDMITKKDKGFTFEHVQLEKVDKFYTLTAEGSNKRLMSDKVKLEVQHK